MSSSFLAPNGRRYVVEPGILDDRAALAFTNGHCHSLALALHRVTRTEMVGFTRTERPFEHVLVRSEDGRLIDIRGARTPAEVIADGGQLSGINQMTLRHLVDECGWVPADPDAASAWVRPLLEQVAANGPYRRIRCFCHEFVLAVEQASIHVEWSERDGGARLVAFGRRTTSEPTSWVRCCSHKLPNDARGEQVIDFTQDAFEHHVRDFEKSIQLKEPQVIANLDAPQVIESPMCPPPAD